MNSKIEDDLQAQLDQMQESVGRAEGFLETAREKMAAAARKRKAMALAAVTGVGVATKALKEATRERNDAQETVEDLEEAITDGREKIIGLQQELNMLRLKRQFAEVVAQNVQANERLKDIVKLRDELYAEIGRFFEDGRKARAITSPMLLSAQAISPKIAASIPQATAYLSAGYREDLIVYLLSETIPQEVFRKWPEERMIVRNGIIEIAAEFWRALDPYREEQNDKAA
jgi:hypothetical protein